MKKKALGMMAGLGCALMAAAMTPAQAAPGDWVKGVIAVPTPREPASVDLPVSLPQANPAHEAWAQQDPRQRIVYNVSRPTLTPMPASMGGTQPQAAVILIPGGGFQFLAMDNEGYDVAKRLAPLGVRVFILKYRTIPLGDSFGAFTEALTGTFVRGEGAQEREKVMPIAVADAQAAIRMVRARAAQWHVDPARVGILGFSAGAMTVLGTLQANAPDARPDFAGMIYGPTQAATASPRSPMAPPATHGSIIMRCG